jgi:hypothetical protein
LAGGLALRVVCLAAALALLTVFLALAGLLAFLTVFLVAARAAPVVFLTACLALLLVFAAGEPVVRALFWAEALMFRADRRSAVFFWAGLFVLTGFFFISVIQFYQNRQAPIRILTAKNNSLHYYGQGSEHMISKKFK